jgi:glutamate-ammonia-ligase adenylyltransferase
LVEAEFLAQFLQLRFAPEHPDLLTTSTLHTFERAAAIGVLPAADGRVLSRATRLYRRLQAVLRLSIQDRFEAGTAPPGLRRALFRAAVRDEAPAPESTYAFDELQATLRAAQAEVAEIFARYCPDAGPTQGQGLSQS